MLRTGFFRCFTARDPTARRFIARPCQPMQGRETDGYSVLKLAARREARSLPLAISDNPWGTGMSPLAARSQATPLRQCRVGHDVAAWHGNNRKCAGGTTLGAENAGEHRPAMQPPTLQGVSPTTAQSLAEGEPHAQNDFCSCRRGG